MLSIDEGSYFLYMSLSISRAGRLNFNATVKSKFNFPLVLVQELLQMSSTVDRFKGMSVANAL